jgi:hypothetical protein
MGKLHKLLLINILKITQIINIKTAISNIYILYNYKYYRFNHENRGTVDYTVRDTKDM